MSHASGDDVSRYMNSIKPLQAVRHYTEWICSRVYPPRIRENLIHAQHSLCYSGENQITKKLVQSQHNAVRTGIVIKQT